MTCVPSARPGDQRRVDERRDRRLEHRAVRDPAVLRRVERALDVVDRRRPDLDPAAQQPRRRRPRPGTRAGRRATRLTLATVPGVRMLPARQRSDGPSVTGSTRPVSRRFGSMPETIAGASISSPPSSTTPVADAVDREDRRDPRGGPDLRPGRLGRRGERVGERRRTAAGEDRLARRPAVVAGGVREQHRGRSRRPRAHRRVADAAPGERRPHGSESRTTPRRSRRPPPRARAGSCGRRPCPARGTRGPSRRPEERVAEARRPDLGRRLVAEVGEEPRQGAHAPVELDERGGVVGGPAADRVDRRGRGRPTARPRGRRAGARTRAPRATRATARASSARARGRRTAAAARPCGRARERGRRAPAPRSRSRRRSGRGPRGRARGGRRSRGRRRRSGRCARRR